MGEDSSGAMERIGTPRTKAAAEGLETRACSTVPTVAEASGLVVTTAVATTEPADTSRSMSLRPPTVHPRLLLRACS